MKRVVLILLLVVSTVAFNLSPMQAQTYGTQYKGIAASRSIGGGVSSARYTSTYDVSGMTAFRSTSSLALSGSALPMSAATGTSLAIWSSGPLREGEDDPFGGETIDDIDNPLEPGTPIGDIPWGWILLLAAVYILKKGFSDKSSLTPNSTSIVHRT